MTMKNALMGSAAALAVMAGSWDAGAQGLYFSAYGGANFSKDVGRLSGSGGAVRSSLQTTVFNASFSTTQTLTFNFTAASNFAMSGAKAETGWVLGAAVGYDFASVLSGMRAELELSMRNNSLQAATLRANAIDADIATAVFAGTGIALFNEGFIRVLPPGFPIVLPGPRRAALVSTTNQFQATFAGTANVEATGKAHTFALMANVWFDIDLDSWITPYIGAGGGYASTTVEARDAFRGEENGFAWQFGAGANVALDAGTSLNIGYRYMDAGTVELEVPLLSGAVGKIDHDVSHQSLIAGLTFKLE
jgi:opacity protein-like surface antigen